MRTFFIKFIILNIFFSFGIFSYAQLWREITETQAQKQAIPIPSYAPLVERTLPAVVVITTEAVVEQPSLEFPGLPAPFGFFMRPEEKQQGQGSGFIINELGFVITNHHVVHGAQKIKIKVGLKHQEWPAKVLGADEKLDIALLQIITDPKEKIVWPFIPLGDSDSLKLGDRVLALGSPFGLHQSVTDGIVSHLHRGGIAPYGKEFFGNHIQTTLGLNPGNSGGPLLDMAGRAAGVNQMINAAGQLLAFSVPINLVKKIIPQLHTHGRVEISYVGIEASEGVSPQYAKALGLSPNESGVIISRVSANSPAEKAGLKPGDFILEVDGKKVTDFYHFRELIAYGGVGTPLDIGIFRKGKGRMKVKVKLERRPDQQPLSQASEKALQEASVDIKSIGLKVINTTDEMKNKLKLNANASGAQVVSVSPKSKAFLVGISVNDVIVEVNEEPITSALQLKNIIDKTNPGEALPTKLRRGDYLIFAPLEKPE